MRIALLLAAVSTAAASVPARSREQISRNDPQDLIVEGRATSLSYEALDEFGMSSAITAQLRISKVLRGRAPSSVITIRYIAHMDLPKTGNLRFHLRRSSTTIWLVCKEKGGLGYICA